MRINAVRKEHDAVLANRNSIILLSSIFLLVVAVDPAYARCLKQHYEGSASLSEVENTCGHSIAINFCYDEPEGVYGLNCRHGHGSYSILDAGETKYIPADMQYPDAPLRWNECKYPTHWNSTSKKCRTTALKSEQRRNCPSRTKWNSECGVCRGASNFNDPCE